MLQNQLYYLIKRTHSQQKFGLGRGLQMARMLLLAGMAFTALAGCQPNDDKDCNCGTVTNDQVRGSKYYLEARNNCTGRNREFEVTYEEWLGKASGDKVCFSNVSS